MRELLTEKFEKPTKEDSRGTRVWKNECGEFHRDGDKPAKIYSDGAKYWYRNGQRHRDGDRPAIIWSDGTKYWYQNGTFIKSESK